MARSLASKNPDAARLPAAQPTQLGGASGAPPQPPQHREPEPPAAEAQPAEPPPPERLWKVVGTTGRREELTGRPIIQYGGMTTKVHLGRVFSERTTDVEHIRKQGVLLELVPSS